MIPFNLPSIGEEEIEEVVATLRSGWLTSGPRTAQFEREFAAYVEAPHALAVNSCTAGLHLALAALGIGPGDEVITTPMTFCATINVIEHVGATPVLADILPDGNIDPEAVSQRITPRTRAILPVHMAGLPCKMHDIWTLARQHGLKVIEDAAHAVGTHDRGRPIGATAPDGLRSDAVAFSFYATKNLTTGEGGMVTTHDAALADRMRVLCLHGISKDAWDRYSDKGNWYYEVVAGGFKYNLSDIQSAIGIHQLRKQEMFIRQRTAQAERYHQAFQELPELELPPDSSEGRHCWHLYIPRLHLNRLTIGRDEFLAALRHRGIGSSVHFIPIPLHPHYRQMASRPENQCPRALELYRRIMSLPLYPALREEDLLAIIEGVKSIAGGARRHMSVSVT